MQDIKKPDTNQTWVRHDSVPAETMPTWEIRRVLAHGDDLMLVENKFRPGETAPEHSHPHAQITYVMEGAMEFTIDGEARLLKKGDSAYIRPDAVHIGVAVEDTMLIDIFSPQREDFLD